MIEAELPPRHLRFAEPPRIGCVVARHQIRRTGEQGAGLALAGLILGWIGVGFALLAVVAVTLVVAATANGGG